MRTLAALMVLSVVAGCGTSPRQQLRAKPTAPPADALAVCDRSACTISAARDVICWGDATGKAAPTHIASTSGTIALGRSLEDSFCALRDTGSVVCWTFGLQDGGPRELFALPRATELAVSWRRVCARAPGSPVRCAATATLMSEIDLGRDISRLLAAGPTVCALHAGGRLDCPGGPSIDDAIDADASDDRFCVASRTGVRCVPTAVIDLDPAWVQLDGLAGADRIAVGADHVCARIGARVRCAGAAGRGALGPNAPTGAIGAYDVPFPAAVSAIDASGARTCARTPQGVSCFGEIGGGVLGTVARGPLRVEARDLVALSANQQTCAVTRSGSVICWGPGEDGQLGDGRRAVQAIPSSVPRLAGVQEVIAGYGLTCARAGQGIVCWGGLRGDEADPGIRLVVTGDVVDWSVESPDLFVLRPSGAVERWNPRAAALARVSDELPATIRFSDAVEIAAMRFAVCARARDGRVRCTGKSPNGEMGSGTSGRDTGVAVAVPAPRDPTPDNLRLAAAGCRARDCGAPITGVAHVRASAFTACAVLVDGRVACWGSNQNGEVGPVGVDPVRVPLWRDDVHDAADVCFGDVYACATLRGGGVHCWGDTRSPVVAGAAAPALAHARAVSCGGEHACALFEDGSARCWGESGGGRLGSSETIQREPRLVPGTR